MKYFFSPTLRFDPVTHKKTEQLLTTLVIKPRTGFAETLEARLGQSAPPEPVAKKNPWNIVFLAFLPGLALLAILCVTPGFVSARVSNLVAVSKEFLYSTFAFTQDGLSGTYLTYTAALRSTESHEELLQASLERHEAPIAAFRSLESGEAGQIIIQEDALSRQAFIALVDPQGNPMRGGIIPLPERAGTTENADTLLEIICYGLGFERAPLTDFPDTYQFTNPTFAFSFLIEQSDKTEPAIACGGGGGHGSSVLHTSIQFDEFSSNANDAQPSGVFTVGVSFPADAIPDTEKKQGQFMRIQTPPNEGPWIDPEGTRFSKIEDLEGYMNEETYQEIIEKTFRLEAYGSLYVFSYRAPETEKKQYDQKLQDIIRSVEILPPLLEPSYGKELATFLHIFSITDQVYIWQNGEWQKKNSLSSTEGMPTATPPPADFPPSFPALTSSRTITNWFSERHRGIDIAGQTGQEIFAAADGLVTVAACGWNGGYGCQVVIDHSKDIETLYAHAAEILVAEGQHVSQGQVIAQVGATGHVTGPALHFEVRANGVPIDPLAHAF